MASIQQSASGLAGSIFAATALGSHLFQQTPEGQARKLESRADKLLRAEVGGASEEGEIYEEARTLEVEAAKMAPNERRLKRAEDILQERREDVAYEKKQERERASSQIRRSIIEIGRQSLSDQQTKSWQDQLEEAKKTLANLGDNKGGYK